MWASAWGSEPTAEIISEVVSASYNTDKIKSVKTSVSFWNKVSAQKLRDL